MTVKELKEELDRYDDDFIVLIPDTDPITPFLYMPVELETMGGNKEEGCLYLYDLRKEDANNRMSRQLYSAYRI